MVPLSSVDAGLLYGVPLMLRSGVTGNFDQFQEMEILSRVLFRHLQERDLAILLRSTASCPNGQRHEQLFLLMAQEFPQTTKQPPQTGLLFRYAQADQLLAEATPTRPCPALQDELGLQYSEYVEESLNTLDCDSFNPLLRASQASAILSENSVALHSPPQTATNGAEEEVQVSSTSDQQAANLSHGEDIENDETDMITAETHAEPDVVMADDSFVDPEDVWNDSAGVGSRKRSMATQDSIENDTDDDDFPGFVYD